MGAYLRKSQPTPSSFWRWEWGFCLHNTASHLALPACTLSRLCGLSVHSPLCRWSSLEVQDPTHWGGSPFTLLGCQFLCDNDKKCRTKVQEPQPHIGVFVLCAGEILADYGRNAVSFGLPVCLFLCVLNYVDMVDGGRRWVHTGSNHWDITSGTGMTVDVLRHGTLAQDVEMLQMSKTFGDHGPSEACLGSIPPGPGTFKVIFGALCRTLHGVNDASDALHSPCGLRF